MKFKPWQPQVLHDRLVEIGPSEGNVEFVKFSYLEFRDAGRVRNVTVFTDLASKLKDTLGTDSASFHFVHGQHVQTGDTASMLVAVGREGGPVYATDMKSRGSDDAARQTGRLRKTGKMLQFWGAVFTLLGIPMLLVFIGIPMIGGGIYMWRAGKKVGAGAQYQQELFDQMDAMVGRIPGVRLV